ncbi:hypothetical protein [Parafrankia sp. FMc2]|uniref:hypothetical protein n=1 Tax=Parafrankia sp. FMc2 TaxID=3233196 RepID=UPI0034D6198B
MDPDLLRLGPGLARPAGHSGHSGPGGSSGLENVTGAPQVGGAVPATGAPVPPLSGDARRGAAGIGSRPGATGTATGTGPRAGAGAGTGPGGGAGAGTRGTAEPTLRGSVPPGLRRATGTGQGDVLRTFVTSVRPDMRRWYTICDPGALGVGPRPAAVHGYGGPNGVAVPSTPPPGRSAPARNSTRYSTRCPYEYESEAARADLAEQRSVRVATTVAVAVIALALVMLGLMAFGTTM